ncbi:MAG: hypothetical protein ACLP00_10800 [Terracidiphilus sp.]
MCSARSNSALPITCTAAGTYGAGGSLTFWLTSEGHADPVNVGFRAAQRFRDLPIAVTFGAHPADDLGVLVTVTSDFGAA